MRRAHPVGEHCRGVPNWRAGRMGEMEPNPYQSPLAPASLAVDQDEPQLPPDIGRLKMFLRVLIVGEIVFGVLSLVVSAFTQVTLPEPLREYLELEAQAPITKRDLFLLAFGVLLLVMVLISSIGLFVFWRPARLLYLIATVFGVVITPLLGPAVRTGWDTPLEETASITAGAILALVYFSPLRVLFEKRRTGV
jgi:hypothetical protein